MVLYKMIMNKIRRTVKPTLDAVLQQVPEYGTNKSGKVVKNVCMTRSGVVQYGIWNLDALNAPPIPEEYKSRMTINVYRPAEVLEKRKDLFTRLPVCVKHPNEYITVENARNYVGGMTGDTTLSSPATDGELELCSTLTFFTQPAIDAYNSYKEVSIAYDPITVWEEGVHNGVPYQLVVKDIVDANHLALVPKGRAGPNCMVLDSTNNLILKAADKVAERKRMEAKKMGLLSNLFANARKKAGVGNSDIAVAKALLLASVDSGATDVYGGAVRNVLKTLPASDGLTAFETELKDFEAVGKDVPKEVLSEAVKSLCAALDALDEDDKKADEDKKDGAKDEDCDKKDCSKDEDCDKKDGAKDEDEDKDKKDGAKDEDEDKEKKEPSKDAFDPKVMLPFIAEDKKAAYCKQFGLKLEKPAMDSDTIAKAVADGIQRGLDALGIVSRGSTGVASHTAVVNGDTPATDAKAPVTSSAYFFDVFKGKETKNDSN